MKHIDKNTYKGEFDKYTDQYLKDAQNKEDGSFYPALDSRASYEDGFSEKKYKCKRVGTSLFNGWLEILLKEQDKRCCYCMRELNGSEISVEHLVPESFEGLSEDEEFAFYCKNAPLLEERVILSTRLNAIYKRCKLDVVQLKLKPHLIAHCNLFTACKKEYGCSCNNDRGNKRILPMMLMEDIEDKCVYKEDGKIQLLYDDVSAVYDTLANLKINSKTLIQMRHLWFLFSRKKLMPTNVDASSEERMKSLIEQAFEGLDMDKCYEQFYNNRYYRELIPKYNWFFDYYLKRYPL